MRSLVQTADSLVSAAKKIVDRKGEEGEKECFVPDVGGPRVDSKASGGVLKFRLLCFVGWFISMSFIKK